MDFRSPDRMLDTDESLIEHPFRPFYSFWPPEPVLIHQDNEYERDVFVERPLLGVLLFDNNTSDARDHAANERTFLSWLRLSVYMAIVAVAIILNFHLKSEPTALERRTSLPFGVIFWTLSVACLIAGLANYMKTVRRYSRRTALVQAGWKTQTVFTMVAATIVAACILFLSTNAQTRQ